MIKLMTLNLWCYFDWQKRQDTLKALITRENPDIIAFQEAQTNFSFSAWPQSDDIAKECDYPYHVFAPTYRRDGQIDRSGNMTEEVSYGPALITKYPIISAETYFLRQHPDHDEACSVLFCKINVDGTLIDVCNVHFGNSDLFADLHLNELLDVCEKRSAQPILLGDFNIFDLAAYKQERLKDYTLSTDITPYVSMPKDNGTLDYIAVPASQYLLGAVNCPDDYVSDHRALLAEITTR